MSCQNDAASSIGGRGMDSARDHDRDEYEADYRAVAGRIPVSVLTSGELDALTAILTGAEVRLRRLARVGVEHTVPDLRVVR